MRWLFWNIFCLRRILFLWFFFSFPFFVIRIFFGISIPIFLFWIWKGFYPCIPPHCYCVVVISAKNSHHCVQNTDPILYVFVRQLAAYDIIWLWFNINEPNALLHVLSIRRMLTLELAFQTCLLIGWEKFDDCSSTLVVFHWKMIN